MIKQSLVSLLVASAAVVACASPTSSSDASDVAPVATDSDLTKAHNDLSAAQQQLILDKLNDHCGDSWCEGDLDWDFQKITCNFGSQTCTFTAKMTDPGDSDGPADDRVFFRSCKMTKIAKFESIIETAANGYQDLTDDFYGKADDCATKLEDTIPKR